MRRWQSRASGCTVCRQRTVGLERMRPNGVVLQADQQPGTLGLPYH
jgi:hypothetical protein